MPGAGDRLLTRAPAIDRAGSDYWNNPGVTGAANEGDRRDDEREALFGRLGVRILSADEARRLGIIGGLLYLVCGLSVLQIRFTAGAAVLHPTAYFASGVILTLVAGTTLIAIRVSSDAFVTRVVPELALVLIFGAAFAIPVVLSFVGLEVGAIGTSVYVLPLILGCFVLRPALSVLLVAMIAAGHGALLARSEGVVAPVSQYLFLIAVLVAAGVLVGGLVDRLDRTARHEQHARVLLDAANASLTTTVAEQVGELERLTQLRRFLAPQVADAVLSAGSEAFLTPHRREIAVVFCDLRGFTAFAAQVEPEEVLDVLGAYYREAGEHLHKFEATVGSFAGDGFMAYFNDPNPCDRPAFVATSMAVAIQQALRRLAEEWSRRGYSLGCGMGIALGHATLGVVGFEGRSDYTPLGTVVNRASRLCDEAKSGQIIVDQSAATAIADDFELAPLPDLTLKGFANAVPCLEVIAPR